MSRIPVLGNAFKHTRKERVRKELIDFIQPIVVTDNEELRRASLVEDMRTGVGADANEEFPNVDPDEIEKEFDIPARRRSLIERLFEPTHKKTQPMIPRR